MNYKHYACNPEGKKGKGVNKTAGQLFFGEGYGLPQNRVAYRKGIYQQVLNSISKDCYSSLL
jgi:hypothetical protein